jgi:spermidine/putrescine transport system permease protein
MIWAIVPVLIAIQFSFNATRSRTIWSGFSLRWYTWDPSDSVWHDDSLRQALAQSFKLAAVDVLIATPLGVLLALGLARWRGRAAGTSNFIMLFPLVTPEIVMGVALLLVFTHVYTFVHTGTLAQILGHVTFSISYVVVIVRGRLFSIGRQYEEAAADLGAPPGVALYRVLLPLLTPAIVASAAIVFALSIDDFVISFWLSSGGGPRDGADADLRRHAGSTAALDQRNCHDHGLRYAPHRPCGVSHIPLLHARGAGRTRRHGRRRGGVRHLVDLTDGRRSHTR